MGLLSWIMNSNQEEDEYTRGYNASREFSEIVMEDDSITDEQLSQQYNIVMTTHSTEYAQGYDQYIEDEYERLNKPWYKFW